MTEILTSPLTWMFLSIFCYAIGVAIQQKTGSPLCNPLLIGVALADMMGGVTSITAIAIVITGIFGAILLPTFLKCIGVRNPMQMGLSIGTAAHAVGTSRAIQLGETEGAISGLAIGVAGLLTAFIVSALSVFM